MKRLALWLMAAVLCLTGACAEQGGEQSKLTAVVEATAAETGIVMQTPEVTPRLVWDENGPMDTEAPQIGKTKMPLNLRRAAEDPANADALFPVEIQVFWEVEPYFRYEGRTMDEWRAQPALEVYRTASDSGVRMCILSWTKRRKRQKHAAMRMRRVGRSMTRSSCSMCTGRRRNRRT